MSAVRLIDSDHDFAVALHSTYLILVWRHQISSRGAFALRRAFNLAREERSGAPVGFLTVIRPECNVLTSAAVREEISGQLRANEHMIGAAAIAYEGSGFVSAVVRSVITAINIATRARFPNDVFADRHAAIAWLTQQIQERDAGAADALEQILSTL